MEIMRFKSQAEIQTYIQKFFPSFFLSFNGKRTLIFSCKYFQPNENQLVSNKRRYKKKNAGFDISQYVFQPNQLSEKEFFTKTHIDYTFCEANINIGYLKNDEIWYIKKVTTHTCGLTYNLEASLIGLEISNTTGYVAPYPSTTSEIKRPTPNNEYIYNLWVTALMQGNGSISDFLKENENKFRYEYIHQIILSRLSEENRSYIGLMRIFGKIVFIVEDYHEEGILEESMRVDEKLLRTQFTGINFHTFLSSSGFLNQFNCTTYILRNDLQSLISALYKQEVIDVIFILPTVYQTYAHEYNILNLHNENIYASPYKNALFFGFFNPCRKPVFEIAIRKRRSQLVSDIQLGNAMSPPNIGYTVEIVGWNGNNERKIIAFAAFDGIINVDIFDQFINFTYYHLSDNTYCPDTLNFTSDSDLVSIKESLLTSLTFIVPFNEDILSLCMAINLPFMINIRSICEMVIYKEGSDTREVYEKFQREVEEFYYLAMYKNDEMANSNNIILREISHIPEKYYLINYNRNSKYLNKRLFGLNRNRLIYNYAQEIPDLRESTFSTIGRNIEKINRGYKVTRHNITYSIDLSYSDPRKKRLFENIILPENNYSNTPYTIVAKLLRQLNLPVETIMHVDDYKRECISEEGGSTYEVNLQSCSCTCNFFNSYLIPCIHAMILIDAKNKEYNIFDYVSTIHTDNIFHGQIEYSAGGKNDLSEEKI